MRILVDTNVLLRTAQRAQTGRAANLAIKTLHRQQHFLCLCPQNTIEFWSVCTRPVDVNGLGLSVAGTERYVQELRKMFTIIPDSLQTLEKWQELVVKHGVVGAKVHDARLVAICRYTALRIFSPST